MFIVVNMTTPILHKQAITNFNIGQIWLPTGTKPVVVGILERFYPGYGC